MNNIEYAKTATICFFKIMLIILLLAACEKYDEGDEKANQSFEKMTVVEKGMYDAVENAWDQSFLANVRQAVSKREVKPLENSIPFIDIANVIKSNNDLTLKINDNWLTETKNKAINGRWDRIDDEWYVKIVNKLGLKETDIQRQELVIEPKVKEKSEVEVPDINKPVIEEPPPLNIKKMERDILLLTDYDDLYYDLKYCQPAIDKYNQIIEERLITLGDKELLIQMAIKCKALKIKEKLNHAKNN